MKDPGCLGQLPFPWVVYAWPGTVNQSVGAGAGNGRDGEQELKPPCQEGNSGTPHLASPRDSGWCFSSSPALQNLTLEFFRPFFDGSAIKAGSLQLPSVPIALLLQWQCGNVSR